MAKRTLTQRRGRGSTVFTATQNSKADSVYINIDERQKQGVLRGEVVNFVTDPHHSGVLAKIVFENGKDEWVLAAEGIFVGQQVEYGRDAKLELGNTLPLSSVSEGCPVFNVEIRPGDGGKMVKSSGMYGIVITKDKNYAYIKMPSGKTKSVSHESRATIGCSAGGARLEKPMVKAGARYHKAKAQGFVWPRTRGVAMNPLDHPFGGSQHHAGKSKSTSRNAPPGRKVGAIASSRTGRRKR